MPSGALSRSIRRLHKGCLAIGLGARRYFIPYRRGMKRGLSVMSGQRSIALSMHCLCYSRPEKFATNGASFTPARPMRQCSILELNRFQTCATQRILLLDESRKPPSMIAKMQTAFRSRPLSLICTTRGPRSHSLRSSPKTTRNILESAEGTARLRISVVYSQGELVGVTRVVATLVTKKSRRPAR